MNRILTLLCILAILTIRGKSSSSDEASNIPVTSQHSAAPSSVGHASSTPVVPSSSTPPVIVSSSSSIEEDDSSITLPFECAPLYDHMETHADVKVGKNREFCFTTPKNIKGVTSWPIALNVFVSYTYVGDVVRDGYLTYSRDPSVYADDAIGGTMMGAVPVDEESGGNVLMVSQDDRIYFQFQAVGPPVYDSLTIDFLILLRDPTTNMNLFGGSADLAPNYIRLHDDVVTKWLNVREGQYMTFEYQIDSPVTRWFEVDLKTAEHELILFGRKDALPTTNLYDWKEDEGSTVMGTIVTSQSLDTGLWYLRVWGEDLVIFTDTATFKLRTSIDQIDSAATNFLSMGLIATIAIMLVL